MRIFIADDAAFVREVLKNHMVSRGHHVVGEAENGEEVLSRIERTLPDLLIIDLVMPLMNGVDVLRVLRPQYPSMKVLICTTLDESMRVDGELYDGKLMKPFNNEELNHFLSNFEISKGA